MENFLRIPQAKQNVIINAGLTAFGSNGYRKTSISDIAKGAGISKSMIFHYFGTKKELYLFLAQYSANTIMRAIDEQFDAALQDFFERVRLVTKIEVLLMQKHPAILSFLKSIYFETDEEVAVEIKGMLAQGDSLRASIGLSGTDVSKFKAGVDPAQVVKLIGWFAEGYVSRLGQHATLDVDDLNREFELCLSMLRRNLYKEEFI